MANQFMAARDCAKLLGQKCNTCMAAGCLVERLVAFFRERSVYVGLEFIENG